MFESAVPAGNKSYTNAKKNVGFQAGIIKPGNFADMEDLSALNQYITTENGVPVFKGTAVAVKTLFEYMREDSLEEFLEEFPSVNREQAEAIIELAIANNFV